MNREAIEKRTLRTSVLMGCILTGIEVTGAIIFRSNTVLMDAIFDAAEIVMIGPFMALVPLLYRPVSERHPYGYAQVESLFLIVKYMVLLVLTIMMIIENVRVILSGGRQVNAGKIAVFEICLGAVCALMYLFMQHMGKRYESPTIHAELFSWKAGVLGSCSVAAAFFAGFLLGDTVLKPVTPYIDSGVAVIMSLILIFEPLRELHGGFRQLILFSPRKEIMDRIRSVIKENLKGTPYEAAFIDVIQTGRKTWIGVYLKRYDGSDIIDNREWAQLRECVTEELKDDFDQLYVEFTPDLPETM